MAEQQRSRAAEQQNGTRKGERAEMFKRIPEKKRELVKAMDLEERGRRERDVNSGQPHSNNKISELGEPAPQDVNTKETGGTEATEQGQESGQQDGRAARRRDKGRLVTLRNTS